MYDTIHGFPLKTILKDGISFLPQTYISDEDKEYVIKCIDCLFKRDLQLKNLLDELQGKAIINYGGGTNHTDYDYVYCDCVPPCEDKHKDCIWRGRKYYNCDKCVDSNMYAPRLGDSAHLEPKSFYKVIFKPCSDQLYSHQDVDGVFDKQNMIFKTKGTKYTWYEKDILEYAIVEEITEEEYLDYIKEK